MVKIYEWDPVRHLETEEDIAYYMEEINSYHDPHLTQVALADVARARARIAAKRDAEHRQPQPA